MNQSTVKYADMYAWIVLLRGKPDRASKYIIRNRHDYHRNIVRAAVAVLRGA